MKKSDKPTRYPTTPEALRHIAAASRANTARAEAHEAAANLNATYPSAEDSPSTQARILIDRDTVLDCLYTAAVQDVVLGSHATLLAAAKKALLHFGPSHGHDGEARDALVALENAIDRAEGRE
jgi:hypothetical protein